MQSCAHNSAPANKQAGNSINRWDVYKQLCIAKAEFGLNDRCLAVLSSLLSFLPEDALSARTGLVVFPSNRQLSLRAHGMPESTLRRHLASLIEAGIIARKDSPTRKRYAHKDNEGGVALAFGFSFMPLLERAQDIARVSERLLTEQRALKRLRDEVSVIRRTIAADFAAVSGQEMPATCADLFMQFRAIVDELPRRASLQDLAAIRTRLQLLQSELTNYLENKDISSELSASAAHSERQYIESLPESLFESSHKNLIDFEVPSLETTAPAAKQQAVSQPVTLSLDMVLRACPDIREYASQGISSWRDLSDASGIVARFLGITGSALWEATLVLGKDGTSIIIAWILQRSGEIQSAGGYLRSLTQKAKAGGLEFGKLLMSRLNRGTSNQHWSTPDVSQSGNVNAVLAC
jgi:replication initiation protein RepC